MAKRVPQEKGPQNRANAQDVRRGKLSNTSMKRLRQFSIAERKAGRKPIIYIPKEIFDQLSKEDRDFIYGY